MNEAMNQQPRIAAVFATMNRAATAVACVCSLAAQTRPPELVVVADNVSSDDTVSALAGLTDLPFELRIHRMAENRGNAGGVQEAMDLAFENCADAVWILDDDSWPRPDALAAMLEKPLDPHVVRHALQIDPKTGRFTWPLLIPDQNQGPRLAWCMDDLPPGDFIESLASWTGALIPREVREKTGAVNGALFIRGEDEEYPWRIEQAGFTQEAVRKAIIDHPGPEDIIHWTCLGKHFFYERGLSDWKFYYKVRNMVWIKKHHESRLMALLMATAYLAATLRFEGIHRLTVLLTAIRDGWQGHLGRWHKHPM